MGQVIYFLSLNLTRIAELRKGDLVKHIRKKKFRRVDYFFRLPLLDGKIQVQRASLLYFLV